MTPVLVQFPHPGAEHTPPGKAGVMPWNTGPHRRKFLRSTGTAIDADGRAATGPLHFWGEWEAESRYTRLASRPTPRHPRWVHEPFWRPPGDGAYRQNTDPYVFGSCFRYSNCKQLHGGRPSALQRLAPGSVLLFGGSVGPDFVVDTVFVVARATPWSPDDADLVEDSTLRAITCESVGTDPRAVGSSFTLYEGATPSDPVNGMFSFVPCQPPDPSCGFTKPTVRLPDLVNPRSRQAPKRSAIDGDVLAEAWRSVRRQVLDQDLLLGVAFDAPPREASSRLSTEAEPAGA